MNLKDRIEVGTGVMLRSLANPSIVGVAVVRDKQHLEWVKGVIGTSKELLGIYPKEELDKIFVKEE